MKVEEVRSNTEVKHQKRGVKRFEGLRTSSIVDRRTRTQETKYERK